MATRRTATRPDHGGLVAPAISRISFSLLVSIYVGVLEMCQREGGSTKKGVQVFVGGVPIILSTWMQCFHLARWVVYT